MLGLLVRFLCDSVESCFRLFARLFKAFCFLRVELSSLSEGELAMVTLLGDCTGDCSDDFRGGDDCYTF